jgi:hypothetical protein
MDSLETAYTVALGIGAAVVGWCANRIVSIGERVAKLESRKCSCSDEEKKVE